MLARHPTEVVASELLPELQGKNAKTGVLVAYISASQPDPNEFEPAFAAAIGGHYWSWDGDTGRTTQFLPMQVLPYSAGEALELHGQVQLGWVFPGLRNEWNPCPQTHGLLYALCTDWADRSLDTCLDGAMTNFNGCLDTVGICGAGAVFACCATIAPTPANLVAWLICMGISVSVWIAASAACWSTYTATIANCRDQHNNNQLLCCAIYCAMNPGDCGS